MAIFIAWGTAYDIMLRKRLKTKMDIKKYSKDVNSDSSGLNCTTYDLTRAITNDNKKNQCVGIGIPSSGVNNNNSDENLAMENGVAEDDKLCKRKNYIIYYNFLLNHLFFIISSITRRTPPLILSGDQF